MASGFPQLNIVLFNTDGDKTVGAEDRYGCMDVILDSILTENYPNLFILAQEVFKGPKHESLCEKLHQDHTRVPWRKEAGVYFNNDTNTVTHYDVKYVGVGTFQRTEDALDFEPNNVFTYSRLTACVLTPKAGVTTGKKILLVSWHGPCKVNLKLNGKPKQQTQDPKEARRRCFVRLVLFLDKLKDRKGCDMVIVGGDFNLPSGEARDLLGGVGGALLDNYTPTDDRPDGHPIDYVVYWPRDELEDTEIAVLRRDLRGAENNRPFDHNILLYRFGDRFSDLARQFASITVYDDEEESDNAEDDEESDDAEDDYEGSDNEEDDEESDDAEDEE